jgi:hypothetical protein
MDVNSQLSATAALRKTPPPQESLHRRLGGLQARYGLFGDDRNLLPGSEIVPGTVSFQPVA